MEKMYQIVEEVFEENGLDISKAIQGFVTPNESSVTITALDLPEELKDKLRREIAEKAAIEEENVKIF